jgi:hypothetical protein
MRRNFRASVRVPQLSPPTTTGTTSTSTTTTTTTTTTTASTTTTTTGSTTTTAPSPPSGGVLSLSVGDASVAEGNLGAVTPLVFTVSLSQAFTGVVRVDYATVDGSATAGVDYTAASGVLSFLPGETSKQVSVLVSGDVDVEADETLTLSLSNGKDASIADGQGPGVIVNDDALGCLVVKRRPTQPTPT